EGLTEGFQGLVRQYASRLPPPDVVRLLAVLSELETQLRTSGNARLAVELLLLRWAMMGRTVELQAVIEALGAGAGGRPAGARRGAAGAALGRDRAPPSAVAPGCGAPGPGAV